MSRDIDNIAKEIIKNTKELHNLDNKINKDISQDIDDLKKSFNALDKKIKNIDNTLEKILDILNSITVFIEENDDNSPDLDDEEDWTPYDERNFSYDNNDDEDNDYLDNDDWSSHEDDS